MKPAAFELTAPETLEETLMLLGEIGDEAKVIAGGQSLVPMLNLRLARPAVLIDLQRLHQLAYIRRDHDGARIGALTRHVTVENSPIARRHWAVLSEGVAHVAHPQIRNRGTLGGSLSHADPAAELPTLMAALDATFVAQRASGRREIPWTAFFLGPFETALEPDELLVEARFAELPPNSGSAFTEYARRTGDYAVGGAAAVVTMGEDARIARASIALLGVPGSPARARAAEAALIGSPWSARLAAEAAAIAVADIAPPDSVHGSGTFKRRIVQAQVEQAIRLAYHRVEEAQ